MDYGSQHSQRDPSQVIEWTVGKVMLELPSKAEISK